MLHQLRPAILLLAVLTGITGIAYPLVVTGIAKTLFPHEAGGSLIERDGVIVGSELIGQSFVDPETGATLTGYFRGRPSASNYDASASGGTNLGPTNPILVQNVEAQITIIRQENGLTADQSVPVDLVTSSASGLDPHISPASATLQVARVAVQRGVTEEQIQQLVGRYTSERTAGVLGEPRVDVLALNLALDQAFPMVNPE